MCGTKQILSDVLEAELSDLKTLALVDSTLGTETVRIHISNLCAGGLAVQLMPVRMRYDVDPSDTKYWRSQIPHLATIKRLKASGRANGKRCRRT